MTRLRIVPILVLLAGFALSGGSSSAVASVPPAKPLCNAVAPLPLNSASGAPTSVLSTSVGTPPDVCTAAPTGTVGAQLAHINTLAHHRRAKAKRLLRRLILGLRAHVLHAPALATIADTGCVGIDREIDASTAAMPGVGSDLAAAALAQALGFTALEHAALATLDADFAAWVSSSGAATVGDWFAVAQDAFALGDDAEAQLALTNAQAAGIALKTQLTPPELGGSGDGSDASLTCLGQLDNILALFNPQVSCSQMPSGGTISGIAGRDEQGPQDAAGLQNTDTSNSGGTLSPDLDCGYADSEISQAQGAPFAGAEIEFYYEVPQPAYDYSIATYSLGAWSPLSGLGTEAYYFMTTADDGTQQAAIAVWDHYTEIVLSGFGPVAGYNTIAGQLIQQLGLNG